MASGHGTAAPQISPSLASVGFASSDGNMGRSKFKDQLIKKLTRTLTLLKPGRNKHKPLNGFVAASSGTQSRFSGLPRLHCGNTRWQPFQDS